MIGTEAAAIMEDLPAIGLDELVAEANLQTRLDRKYVVPVADLDEFLGGLPSGTRALEIDDLRTHGYRSVYLDTPDLVCYRSSAQPRRRRFKIRMRSYLESDLHFWEIKTRGPRGVTVKDRIPCEEGDPRLNRADGIDQIADVLDKAGVAPGVIEDLAPALTTKYRRTTLYLTGTHSRVTIDTGLTWLDGSHRLVVPEIAIVETKSGRSPSEADRLLWSLDHRPCPISKYGTGLAALRPDLPSNKWHRVLRRHITTQRPSITNQAVEK